MVLRGLRGWGNRGALVPLRARGGGLRLAPVEGLGLGEGGVGPDALFPPTEEGWREFVDAPRGTGLEWGELDKAASWWWPVSVPPLRLPGSLCGDSRGGRRNSK